MLNVDVKHKRWKVRCDMWNAEVVTEKTADEECPFEVCGFEKGLGCEFQTINRVGCCMPIDRSALRDRGKEKKGGTFSCIRNRIR